MAKKKVDMSKLTLGSAKPLIKKTPTTGDEAVASIHKVQVEPRPAVANRTETVVDPVPVTVVKEQVPVVKEVRKEVVRTEETPKEVKSPAKKSRKLSTNKKDLTRITVDVEKPLHKRIKIKALNNDLSIREYIINLIDKDLQRKS